jgi:hypothetical protein
MSARYVGGCAAGHPAVAGRFLRSIHHELSNQRSAHRLTQPRTGANVSLAALAAAARREREREERVRRSQEEQRQRQLSEQAAAEVPVRVRVEIMGNCGFVGNSQSVLIMIDSMIITRTTRRRACH